MTILSIDSGIEKTGYAIFQNKQYFTSGLILTSKNKPQEKRIAEIYVKVKKIIEKYKPQKIILEQLFFFKNQKTAVSVAQAQGIIFLLAAQNLIKVEFLTPLQIKQTITGYGKADKKSIKKMLSFIFPFIKDKQDDEIDAIACGLTYCYLNQKIIK